MRPIENGLVSIILPVYNGEEYIQQAIDSALEQTYRDFELIISDNASTDQTEKICKEYESSDSRIKYFRHSENRGGPWNARFAMEQMHGEYFTMLAHDDALEPYFLEKSLDYMTKNPRCILVSSDIEVIDNNGSVIRIDRLNKIRDEIPWKKRRCEFFRYPVSKTLFCVYGLTKTSASSVFDFKYHRNITKGSEMPLLARFSILGEITVLPEILRKYRQHEVSTYNTEVKKFNAMPKIFKRVLLLENLYKIRFDQLSILLRSKLTLTEKLYIAINIYSGYFKEFFLRLIRLPRKILTNI